MELSVFVLSILKAIDGQISLFIPEICLAVGGNIYFELALRYWVGNMFRKISAGFEMLNEKIKPISLTPLKVVR